MSVIATTLLNVARSQIGYLEGPAANQTKYGQWYGVDRVPYCAIGLSWAGSQAGANDILLGRWAYCPYWVSAWKRAGAWYDHTRAAQSGDVVFFDWSGRHDVAEHVGIVESTTSGAVNTIEFNTGGGPSGREGVWRRRRSLSLVTGFGRPAYGREGTPTALTGYRVSMPLVLDGVWGAKTTQAVQSWVGVTADAVIGPVTRRALQSRLLIEVDGQWGPVTRRTLQHFLGVVQDGQWGPITVKHLQSHLNGGGKNV